MFYVLCLHNRAYIIISSDTYILLIEILKLMIYCVIYLETHVIYIRTTLISNQTLLLYSQLSSTKICDRMSAFNGTRGVPNVFVIPYAWRVMPALVISQVIII